MLIQLMHFTDIHCVEESNKCFTGGARAVGVVTVIAVEVCIFVTDLSSLWAAAEFLAMLQTQTVIPKVLL